MPSERKELKQWGPIFLSKQIKNFSEILRYIIKFHIVWQDVTINYFLISLIILKYLLFMGFTIAATLVNKVKKVTSQIWNKTFFNKIFTWTIKYLVM